MESDDTKLLGSALRKLGFPSEADLLEATQANNSTQLKPFVKMLMESESMSSNQMALKILFLFVSDPEISDFRAYAAKIIK